MNNISQSKAVAWLAMLTVVAVFIVTVCLRVVSEVWDYAAIFCAFMTAFCHLMALNLSGMSREAGRKLDKAAMVFGFLTVVAIIVIFILYQIS